MGHRNLDKSCRLPSGRIVRLGRREVPSCPWSAIRIGGYFVVQRKAPGSVSIETYREPFELQSTVLESSEDAEALAVALNARALRLTAAALMQDTPKAA